ncbi:ATP-binding protein [Streptomyces sp. NPDC046985]|uniref:ATP-binding protein n=1 Tax=Streptomyces sp. NPDC046985 TaxID=3155377 RepID=UPI003402660F
MFTARSDACAPADARRLAVDYLRAHCPAADLEAVQIVLSELVTNAVRHTATGIWSLALLVADGTLTLEVRDESPHVPRPRNTPPLDGHGGLGMGIVDRLADDLALRVTETGKTITARWKLTR